MIKNDYRRSLIMLRPHAPGYSGHVRLERRTLMGSMYFVISVPTGGGVLCASLIRRNSRGLYIAEKIGELRRDGRGQASLAWSFDPRNIGGRELEEYWIIAVVNRQPGGRCEVVLSGNVNGSREVNWDLVRAAACEACSERPPVELRPIIPGSGQRPPANDIPARPGEGPLGPQTPSVDIPAVPGEGPLGPQTPSVDTPAVPEEGPLGPQTPSVDTPAVPEERPLGPQTPSVDTPAVPGEGLMGSQIPSLDATVIPGEDDFGGLVPPLDTPALPDDETVGEEDAAIAFPEEEFSLDSVGAARSADRRTAAEVLGMDSTIPWPGVSEQLRNLFTSQPVQELLLNDGYTYVSAPMPQGSGYDHAEIGVKVEDGVPVSVSYALPSRYTPEPPPGLEDYVWKGGASDGWWTLETDAGTGEKLN